MAKNEKTDPFDMVETTLKSSGYSTALKMLLNSKNNRIVSPYSQDLNHAWYLVGVVYFKQKKYRNALQAFIKSYRHWREDIEAVRAIATCHLEMGKPKTAIYHFIKARKLAGSRYKYRDVLAYNLGNAHFDMGAYDRAISEYNKVRDTDKHTYRLAQLNIKHAKKNLAKIKC